MAVPCVKVSVDSDDSSSEDEELQRCKEAVWDAHTVKKKDEYKEVKQSKRLVVADHEHDGNELQVTQGFRTHVAKKLVRLLDSYISELQPETSSCAEASNGDDDDEGFRLFSTSVPGQRAEDPPTPPRRRPVPSSSDSDSEMETRLKEAAVSIADLLPSLPRPESLTKIKKKQEAEGEESHVVVKKKKRKESEEECEKSFGSPQSNGPHGDSEQEDTRLKVKKKKKKKKNLNEEESEKVLKSDSAASLPQRDADRGNSEQEKVKKKRKKRQEASD